MTAVISPVAAIRTLVADGFLTFRPNAGAFVAEWSDEDPRRAEVGLRLGYALHWLWLAVGLFNESRQRLTRALGFADGTLDRRAAAAHRAVS